MKDFLKFVKKHTLIVVIVGIMTVLSLTGYFMSVITLAKEKNPDVLSYVNQNVFAAVAIHNIKESVTGPDGLIAKIESNSIKTPAEGSMVASNGDFKSKDIKDINSEDLSHIYKEHTRVSIDDVNGDKSDKNDTDKKSDDKVEAKKENEKSDATVDLTDEALANPDSFENGDVEYNEDGVIVEKLEEEPVTLEPITANNNYFLDALFIGDSRQVGFGSFSNLPNITVYAQKAFQIYTVESKALINTPLGKITVPQALLMQENRYKKVYLMFGLNEMGLDEGKFDEYYYHLIDLVKYTQPDAVVYVEGIIHVSSEKDADSSCITNAKIDARNEQLRRIADEEGVIFLDLNEVFTDENNALQSNYAGDGVHLKAQYINIWTDYLKTHAYRKSNWEEPTFDTEFTGDQFPYVMNYYMPQEKNEEQQ